MAGAAVRDSEGRRAAAPSGKEGGGAGRGGRPARGAGPEGAEERKGEEASARAGERRAREAAPVDVLRDDVLLHCLAFVDAYSAARFGLVCREWQALVRRPEMWRELCLRVWETARGSPDRWVRQFGGSYRSLFLRSPHIRFDGAYVLESVEWRAAQTCFAPTGAPPRILACRHYRVLRFLPGGAVLYGLVNTYNEQRDLAVGSLARGIHRGRYRVSRTQVLIRVDVGHLVMDLALLFDDGWRHGHERLEVQRLAGARPSRPHDVIEFPAPEKAFLFERNRWF